MSSELAVHDVTQDKIDLIKQTVAKGTTPLEFELFLHACKRTGLDPLMKQIYAIKRLDRKTGKEVMSIQTGIDGYRLIADRTGAYAGSDEPTYLIAEDKLPDVASVTVYKLVGGIRCPFSASARWMEYYSDTSLMWKKMPFLMLGKCAEALALRKAFPAELSGVYTHEEMAQADNEPPVVGKTFEEKFPAQPPVQPKIAAPAPIVAQESAFIWSAGKPPEQGGHKGKAIDTIPLDYLQWYVSPANKWPKQDHVEAARAELIRVDTQAVAPQAVSTICAAYIEQIGLCETVSECQGTTAQALSDESLNVFEQTQVEEAGEQRMAALRG